MSQLLTLNQAARACCVSRRTINRWIARRMLSVVRPTSRSPRIRTADLERTLEKFTQKALI
jgi:excisionase family DNA binding protein